MKNWIWLCPLCNAGGKKPVQHYRALHYGKWHLIDKHGRRDLNPILIRVKSADREVDVVAL